MGLTARLLVSGAALLALAAAPAAQEAPSAWPDAWARLAEARAAPESAPERAAALEALRAVLRAEPDSARAALLKVHLDRLEGRTAVLEAPPGPAETWPYQGEELWLAAEVLPPSPARAGAVRRALETIPGPVPDARVQLAWRIGVDEARALRLEAARAVQEALHRRYAAVWSAMDLALTESRLGAYADADQVLAEQIAREDAAGRPTGDLWAQRGTLALGMGDEARGRDYLGLGVARGSSDAAVVLARLDLAQGRLEEARAGFRALLLTPDPSPWAPRGYGMALLPRARPPADHPAPERT